MSRLLTTRRSEWVPGLAVLVTAVVVGGILGVALGSESWPVYVGLVALVLLGIGALERVVLRQREKAAAPRARGKLRVIHGGKSGYDLENDERTNSQRYLM